MKHLPTKKIILVAMVVILLVFLTFILMIKPSHDRNWEIGQEKTPHIGIEGDRITVSNFRNFSWNDDGIAIPKYETREFDLDKIESVDVFISHFSDFEGLAHIFLSFGFSDEKYTVVSVETRREIGEEFSPTKGLFRKFEIIHVIGSESDIVGVRTGPRNERVYLYRTIAGPEKAKELFLKISEDINDIHQKPRFYNTLFNNCTNAITRRVEDISDVKFPITYKTILPGYFDTILYDMNLIEKRGSFEDTKIFFKIDNNSVSRENPDFELNLRDNLYLSN